MTSVAPASQHDQPSPSPAPNQTAFTDVAGVAAMLGKSTSTIYKWRAARFIPFHQTTPNAPLQFDIEVVKSWWTGLHTQGKSKLS